MGKTKPPRYTTAKHRFREVWLDKAMAKVRKHFKTAGYDVPEHVRVTTGWPSRGAFGKRQRVLGQAWSTTCSKDRVHEIIISLYLDDAVRVLDVLIHEVIHATIGVDQGHGKAFRDVMGKVGLTGKPTATTAGPELVKTLKAWVDVLGPYPHAQVDGADRKKQTTRLLKLECDCGLKIRVAQKWIDEYSTTWDCPCGGQLEAE